LAKGDIAMNQPYTHEISPEITTGISLIFFLLFAVIGLALLLFSLWVYCRIFSKTGYNWAMGLIVLIPGFGVLIALLILAFGSWPIQQELEMHRRNQGGGTPYPQDPPPPAGNFRNV
jgi:uncharacterized membrane protein YhaH (DUF805 family)